MLWKNCYFNNAHAVLESVALDVVNNTSISNCEQIVTDDLQNLRNF